MEECDSTSPAMIYHKYTRPKRECLIMILVVAAIDGLATPFVPSDLEVLWLVAVPIALNVCCIKWAWIDADQYQVTLPRYFVPLMVICPGPLILLPIHLIRSRGWRNGLWACLKGAGMLAMWIALQLGASSVAQRLMGNSE